MDKLRVSRQGREVVVEREDDLRGGDVVQLRVGSDSYSLLFDHLILDGDPGNSTYVFYSRGVTDEGITRWRIPSSVMMPDVAGKINGEQLGSSAVHTYPTDPKNQQYNHLNSMLAARRL